MLNTAKKLAKLITMNTDKITKRDKQDFWIQNHPKEVNKLMKKKQLCLTMVA